jgi:broad specificity phosphatase PhoE
MKILLIRHFKVNYDWRFSYNAAKYEKACFDYDNSAVMISDLIINSDNTIYSSTMIRAIETTKAIFKRVPDFFSDSLREVPISPFMRTNIPLPRFIWDIVGRVQWRFNHKSQPETYKASRSRIDGFMDSILAKNEECFIVAHGFVIQMIIKKLKKSGFKGLNPFLIKTGFPYEYCK